eukprot:GILJ01026806.1.p1 GENE.GILJ01026806.1~~GILJ01026806.1.p1  ORF type:complete len:129 (-),score=12.27 GILJ01026806.1:16-402(-)
MASPTSKQPDVYIVHRYSVRNDTMKPASEKEPLLLVDDEEKGYFHAARLTLNWIGDELPMFLERPYHPKMCDCDLFNELKRHLNDVWSTERMSYDHYATWIKKARQHSRRTNPAVGWVEYGVCKGDTL